MASPFPPCHSERVSRSPERSEGEESRLLRAGCGVAISPALRAGSGAAISAARRAGLRGHKPPPRRLLRH